MVQTSLGFGTLFAVGFMSRNRHEHNEENPCDEQIGDLSGIEYLEKGPVQTEQTEGKDKYPDFCVLHP